MFMFHIVMALKYISNENKQDNDAFRAQNELMEYEDATQAVASYYCLRMNTMENTRHILRWRPVTNTFHYTYCF